jgi:hypothetical protein
MSDAALPAVFIATLPLLAAEIFSAVQFGYYLAFIYDAAAFYPHEDYSSTAGLFTALLIGPFIIFLGSSYGSHFLTSRRTLLSCAVLSEILGFILITVLERKLREGEFTFDTLEDLRKPFGYAVPGFFFSELSISILNFIGRSGLIAGFQPRSQVRAQTLAATFILCVTFLFRLIFGLYERGLDEGSGLKFPLGISAPFVVIGLIIVLCSTFLESPAEPLTSDLGTVASIDSFPGIFGAAVPFFLVNIVFGGLDLSIPLTIATFDRDDPGEQSIGLGIVAVGLLALVGICGAWGVQWLGIRKGLVVGLLLSLIAQGVDLFQLRPPSRSLAICDTVFSGFALGASLSGIWAAVGISVPQTEVTKYTGILVGFATAFQGLVLLIFGLNVSVYSVFLLLIAGVLVLSLPGAGTQEKGESYADAGGNSA